MQMRNFPGRVLLWILLGASTPLFAASGVTRWENTFHWPLPGGGGQDVLAARELADGTTLTVVRDNYGLTTLHFDHSGSLLGSATSYPGYPSSPFVASIDPFGAVFFASFASGGLGYSGDIWMMKYDGLTGSALWPSGVTIGYGNHANDSPLDLFVTPQGDVVLHSADDVGNGCILEKFDGGNGQRIWGPVVAASGASASVAGADANGDVDVASFGASSTFSLIRYSGSTGAIVWQKVEPGHDLKPVTIGFDGSGNVVVTGNTSSAAGNFEADRYSGATGQRIWGPAVWTPPNGNTGTAPDLAAVGSDGSVVIFGHTFANSQSSEALVKFRGADGALLWGPVPNADPTENTYGAKLALAGNGDVILNAQIQTGQSSSDSKMWRYDGATGDVVWGPQAYTNGAVGAAFVASNGRVFVGMNYFNGTDDDALVLERDGATGDPAWGESVFSGAAAGWAHLWDLTAGPDGNTVVTGEAMGFDGNGAWATLKYERSTGAVLWGPVFLPTGWTSTYSPWRVLTDAAGDVLVGGWTIDGMTVVKYSGVSGAQLWVSSVAPGANVTGFALDPGGNPVVTGYLSVGKGFDVATAKLSGATGATLWGPVTYDSGSDDFPDFLATDSSGDVILAGHSDVLGPPGFLFKYAAVDGSTIWGPVTQDDYATWLEVDPAGDVFRESYPASWGITTTKFSGASGAVLWGPTTLGGAGNGYGVALALDGAGDVFVTGALHNGQTDDYVVIKYRGSDGANLWGPVAFDSGLNDSPYDVVVDGSGNAVVTGVSLLSSGEQQTATLSYDGATGALRWGPVGRNIARDSVNGLAASGSTVYVGSTRGDLGYIVDAIDETLGIVALPGVLPAASCGHAIDVPLGAANGTPPYTWSVVGGGLPPAVALGAGGDIIGTPAEEGVFAFTVQVQDAAMATAARDFSLAVGPGGPLVPVAVVRDAACQLTLSIDGSYAAYDWLPGGETSPEIVVDPTEPTPYGVILDDGTSCRVRGAVTITPFDPSCLAPTVASISPGSGPGAGTPVVVAGSKFDPNAALSIGGSQAIGLVFDDASTLQATTPALAPGTVADVLVVNPDGRYAMLPRSFAADFLDVPASNPFYADIMKVLRAGITAGCGGGNYCPNGSVTRAQMAVFLLKAQHGFFFVPPPCAGIFADVACPGAFAADWIEQLSNEGITSGCGGGNYCPDAAVTREQMAVFLLKAEHGSSFTPPPCVGVFGDVPCSSPFASWIEQLYDEGITGGCGNGNYCPSNPNTRAQMGVFLTKTFALP